MIHRQDAAVETERKTATQPDPEILVSPDALAFGKSAEFLQRGAPHGRTGGCNQISLARQNQVIREPARMSGAVGPDGHFPIPAPPRASPVAGGEPARIR